jgi:hypothetical protein
VRNNRYNRPRWEDPEIYDWSDRFEDDWDDEDETEWRDERCLPFLGIGLGVGFIAGFGCNPRRHCFPRFGCYPRSCYPRISCNPNGCFPWNCYPR